MGESTAVRGPTGALASVAVVPDDVPVEVQELEHAHHNRRHLLRDPKVPPIATSILYGR